MAIGRDLMSDMDYDPDRIDRSEYIACPFDDLEVLFKYVDKTPISNARWSNFGKEPPSMDVLLERYANDPNIRDGLGEIDFSPGSQDYETVVSDFRKQIREYRESQWEEPIVHRWAEDKDGLVNYLKNHIDQCEKCRESYADFIVDKALLVDGDNIWDIVAKKDWMYLDIGTKEPGNFMYFSSSLLTKRMNLGSSEEWEDGI
jgi:hypothetical protein